MCMVQWYFKILIDSTAGVARWFVWRRPRPLKTTVHRNMSDVLSKLRDVHQKKMDVLFKDVCVLARIYLACPITSVECERSFSVLLHQLTHNRPVSVESRAHSRGTFCKNKQLTWTAWLKISFVLTTNARITLDYRLVGSNAALTICRWLCYSVNVWHGECDEPDGGKRGIGLG